jgi:hypothetical protein
VAERSGSDGRSARGGRPGGRTGGSSGPGGSRSSGRPPKPGTGRAAREQRQAREPRPDRGPALPEDIDIEDLDPAVINELRTLPEDLREKVAGHLVAAEWALLDEDTETARKHAQEAKRLAGRVASVREAMGIVAYRCGDYAEALAELRTVRRISGDDSFVPMMADCERGLGRPERALELLREVRDPSPGDKGGDRDRRCGCPLGYGPARSSFGAFGYAGVEVPACRWSTGEAGVRLRGHFGASRSR